MIYRHSSLSIDNEKKCVEFKVSAHLTIHSFIEVEIMDDYKTASIANASVWQIDENGMWSVIQKTYYSAAGFRSDPGVYFNCHYEHLLSIAIFPPLKGRRGYHVMLCL